MLIRGEWIFKVLPPLSDLSKILSMCPLECSLSGLWKISHQLIIFLILAAKIPTFKWKETRACWELQKAFLLRRLRPVLAHIPSEDVYLKILFSFFQMENCKQKRNLQGFSLMLKFQGKRGRMIKLIIASL